MTSTSIAVTLTLGFVAFISFALLPTTAVTQPMPGGAPMAGNGANAPPEQRPTQATCEAKGPNYNYDPQTGRCIKSITKVEPPTSGGVGGGGEDEPQGPTPGHAPSGGGGGTAK